MQTQSRNGAQVSYQLNCYEPRKTKSGREYCDCGGELCLELATRIKSEEVSVNMIRTTHTRELDINRITTVGDLFALIDLPYRITKKATVSIEAGTATLRLEWRGEPE